MRRPKKLTARRALGERHVSVGPYLAIWCALAVVVMGCNSQHAPPHVSGEYPSDPESKTNVNPESSVVGLTFPDGNVKDIGVVWESSVADCAFRVTNTSTHPISFRNGVTTTCGCTSGTLSPTTLQPGETGTLSISVSAPPEAGEQKEYVATIHRELENGGLQNLSFFISVMTKAAWIVRPDALSARIGSRGGQELKLNVVTSNDRSLNLKSIGSTLPDSICSGEIGIIPPDSSRMVTLVVPETAEEGRYFLTLTTDDENVPIKTIPVQILREAAIRVVPRSLVLRKVDADHGVSSLQGKFVVTYTGTSTGITLEFPESVVAHVVCSEPVDFEQDRKISTIVVKISDPPLESLIEAMVCVQLADGTVLREPVKIRTP